MLGYVASNKRGNERTKLETSAEKKNTGKMWGSKSRKGHAMGISRAKVEMKGKGNRKQT